jgi:hypothetical protein
MSIVRILSARPARPTLWWVGRIADMVHGRSKFLSTRAALARPADGAAKAFCRRDVTAAGATTRHKRAEKYSAPHRGRIGSLLPVRGLLAKNT